MEIPEFLCDFRKAQQDAKPAGFREIKWGDYQDQIKLIFELPGSEHKLNIVAAVQNILNYPKNHEYIVFCEDEPPPHIEGVLQNLCGTSQLTISEFITILSNALFDMNLADDKDLESTAAKGDESCSTAMYENELCLAAKNNTLSAAEYEGESCSATKVDSFTTEAYREDCECESSVSNTAKKNDQSQVLNSSNTTAYQEIEPVVESSLNIPTTGSGSHLSSDLESLVSDDDAYDSRLEADLDLAQQAGFAVAHLVPPCCPTSDNSREEFVTVSVPMLALGISEEVLDAWEVDLMEHLILIIHYPKGYKTHEELQGNDEQGYDKSNIGIRVVAGKYPGLTLGQATDAFKMLNPHKTIREIFISKHLSTLMEEGLVPILRFRNVGLDWHGAESWFSDFQGMDESLDPNAIPDEYFVPEKNHKFFPDIVTADHFTSHKGTNYSFPLLAMQFVLRHFVRCTEFCLTCHRKMNLNLEAIKPYYCERPLCLFKYLNMGLVEHEVATKPYVVDLLISFCYCSGRAYNLNEFPDGLSLTVPYVRSNSTVSTATSSNATSSYNAVHPTILHTPEYNVGFDYNRREINFNNLPISDCPVKKDTWVEVNCPDTEFHCRIADTSNYPVVTFDDPVILSGLDHVKYRQLFLKTTGQPPPILSKPPEWKEAKLTLYNVQFDLLSKEEKCDVICKLLDTLPTVKEMQKYLADHHPGDLQNWVERLSPAALRLFRWIVATNRACIMQVDGDDSETGVLPPLKQERLFGMEGYMQFRFAMGAPDKEQRFLNEVRKTAERLNLKYPTIFAWHGSPLHNWHMIIREGLHFKNIYNGRAYGHGVYHAKDAATSESYSLKGLYLSKYTLPGLQPILPTVSNQMPPSGIHSSFSIPSSYTANISTNAGRSSVKFFWPSSVLNVSSALALNEIVNAPREFVCEDPYYVITQLDWIQTRYLLVKCKPEPNFPAALEMKPLNPHPQDPKRIPRGISGPIEIPASAIKSGRGIMRSGPLTAGKRKSKKPWGPKRTIRLTEKGIEVIDHDPDDRDPDDRVD